MADTALFVLLPCMSSAAAVFPICVLCAAPLPAAGAVRAREDGVDRAYCCRGCAAMAELIATVGAEATKESQEATRSNTVYRRAAREHEVGLDVHGVHCTACVHIIESALGKLNGVTHVAVDVAHRRARVRWDPARASLDGILAALEAVGYPSAPEHTVHAQATRQREARTALK